MEKKEIYSIREISIETGYSKQYVLDLIRKLGLSPEISPRGDAGVRNEYFLADEEAQKIFRYADKRKKEMTKRQEIIQKQQKVA